MSIFYRSVKLFIIVSLLFSVSTDFAWAEFKFHYRYKNRSYTKIRAQLCNQEKYAIELARAIEDSMDKGLELDEISRLYETNLSKNHPKCFFEQESKGVNLDIIPTEGKRWGILRIAYYENDKGYTLYHLYMKNFNELRLYDSQEQLISLIESGEINWYSLSDAEKDGLWVSLEDDYTKKLQDVLRAKGLQ